MEESFYKKMIKESPIGYAYHKIICDKKGIPCDYEFIEVNDRFELMTGLKRSRIIGKKVTKVIPGIEKSEFNWIKEYGEIALYGGENSFEQFSEQLKKWYKISVSSSEKYYFITRFFDITKERNQMFALKRLISLNERFLKTENQDTVYQEMCDEILLVSKAKFVVFNLFDEYDKSYTTVALSGDKGRIGKAMKIIGYNVEGKKWNYDSIDLKGNEEGTIVRYEFVKELAGKMLPKPIMTLLERTFNFGEAIIIEMKKGDTPIGDFVLIMDKSQRFEDDFLAELFSKQLGMAITRKKALDALQKEKMLTDAIFECVPGFLYVYDEAGNLVKWNKTFEKQTGYDHNELSEMNIKKWFNELDYEKVMKEVKKIFKGDFAEIEADMIMKNASRLPIKANGVGFKMEGKKYFTGVAVDTSDFKKHEAEIIEAKEYFELMFNTNPDVALVTRLSDGVIIDANDGLTNLSGYSRDEAIGKSVVELGLYENETDRLHLLKELKKNKFVKNMEIGFRQKDGVVRNGLLSSKVIIIDKVPHIISNIADISDQKINEKELSLSNERYKSIFDKSPIGISVTNSIDGSFISVNAKFAEICGRTEEELLNGNWTDITYPDDVEEDLNFMRLLNDGKISSYNIDKRYIRKDNSLIWINMTIVPIRNENNQPCHLCMIMDISEKKAEEKLLRYMSYHDHLTGLYNRRFFEEQLSMLNTQKYLPLTVVMFDFNGLKLINDSFGHLMGDNLLKKISNVVKKECKDNEFVARTGGDEFIILMPNTSKEEAEKRVRYLKTVISKKKIDSVYLSVSFGFETKNNLEENIQEVLKNAEDDMYRKKINESSSMRSKTIQLIMNTLFEKSNREMLHSKRVSEICEDIAKALNFEKDDINQIKTAGLMHDIGKIGVDEKILNKPSKLDGEEWKEIRRHPEIGSRILNSVNEFSNLSDFILQHHERPDGKGYPKGITGEEISVEAKIIAIADAYDAITRERPYRSELAKAEAITEMKKYSGTQFDPEILEIFIKKLKKTDY